MSIDMTWQTLSQSAAETEALAGKLASNLRGGEVIELKSDLGGGKTTFTRGLVRSLGSNDRVASPSFMVSKEYATKKFRVVHFDFYRLSDAGNVAHELAEAALDDKTICVVEWGDIVDTVLPARRTVVTIDRVADKEDERTIHFKTPDAYLQEGF